QQVRLWQHLMYGGRDLREILALVIGGDDDQGRFHASLRYSKLQPRVNMLSSSRVQMQILKARFRGHDDFMQAYSTEKAAGSLFVATTTPLESGEDVIVELVCDGLPNKVLIRGQVVSWRPALPRLRVRAGATV